MPLTAIRLITSETLGQDKFEVTTTESGVVFYTINGQSVNRVEFEERVLAAYERKQANREQEAAEQNLT